jgi:hypothetical protein
MLTVLERFADPEKRCSPSWRGSRSRKSESSPSCEPRSGARRHGSRARICKNKARHPGNRSQCTRSLSCS